MSNIPIITKRIICEDTISLFCKDNNINRYDLTDDHCYMSSSLGIAMEYLGLIQSQQTKDYIESRAGCVAITESGIITFRDVLEQLPDDGDLS